jgi:4-amino-4-deoxy-L-arabinose transferase-like glycosyltransferase
VNNLKSLNRFLYFLALVKFVLPYLLQNGTYEPHRDELLYLAEGSHPAFGYMEVPPMIFIFAWLTQHLGNSIFWIKFWPSLMGGLNLILVGRMVISLGGRGFALFLIFCSFFLTGFLRVHFLFQPNAFEVFFYSLIAFGLIRFIQSNENKWLYVAGLGAGLGLLSKYSVTFYLISLLPALLLTRQRRIFLNRHFYLALGLAFLIFLPNLVWQYINHFPVIYHMKELSSTQLQFVPISVFLIEQLLMFLPCCFIWVIGFFYLLLNKKMRPFIFLCWAYLGVIAILLWFHGKSYYSLGLYPILFGFGSLAIEQWAVGRRYYLRRVITLIITISGIYFLFIGIPIFGPEKLAAFYQSTHANGTGLLRWEDQRDHSLPQDFADMLGWDEMARIAANAYHSMDSSQRANTIIFCDNYGMAGAINFYRKKYQLPEAYSDNASFLYWIPDSIKYQNLVLLTTDPDEMKHAFILEFEHASVAGRVMNPYAREYGTQVILLTGASDKFRRFFHDKLVKDRIKTRGF